MSGRARGHIASIVVGLVAFGVYAGTITHALVWDDLLLGQVIDTRIRQGGLASLLQSEFLLDLNFKLGYYRPVVLLSLWIDSLAATVFPYSYHLTNVLLHVLNSLLVLWFLRIPTRSDWGPALGALLFAVHPLHTESVAFVSGRTDLWATAFVLLSTIAWTRDRAGLATCPRIERVLGVTALALGALSKEIAFLLPAVLLAWDLVEPREAAGSAGRWLQRNRPWILGWGIALALAVLIRLGVAGIGFDVPANDDIRGVIPREVPEARQIPGLLATHLRLLVIPWPLNTYYTLSQVRLTGATVAGTLCLLFLCVGTATKSCRMAGLRGILWILAFLLPVSGILPLWGAVLAERFLYLPSVGLSLMLCCAVDRLSGASSLRRPIRFAVLALLLTFGAATVARSDIWRDDLTLFGDMVRTSPMFGGSYCNLGNAYLSRGRYEDALSMYKTAIRLVPAFAAAHNNMGTAYMYLGRYANAVEAFGDALKIQPNSANACNNMGNAYLALGRNREAVEILLKAVKLGPDDPLAHNNLGNAYLENGDNRKAVESYRRAISLRPDYAMAHYNLCLAYLNLREPESAVAAYNTLAAIDRAMADRLMAVIRRQNR